MKILNRATLALFLVACGSEGNVGEQGAEDGLAPFDPSVVVYRDGCEPVPEARACVEAHPVQFLHGNAAEVSRRCEDLGYTCCDPQEWISQAAASCIADTDVRLATWRDNTIGMSCYPDIYGPMYDIYETGDNGGLIGLGIHAATGRITWYDDGSGVFS